MKPLGNLRGGSGAGAGPRKLRRRVELRAKKPDPTTAEELYTRISRREAKALGELYDRLGPRLLGIVQEILADRKAAEEVLLDVLLQVWREAPRIQSPEASVLAWLALTARAAAVERLRSQRQLPRLLGRHQGRVARALSWFPGPGKIALLDGRRDLLKKVVQQLPPSQRRALDLAVFGGYTESEIAQQLGEPLARVKSELRASMRFLRHRLEAILGTWAANI